MKQIGVTESKCHCLRILEEAQSTGEPIEILKRGKPFATVLPAANPLRHRPGMFKDLVKIVGDIEVDGSELGIQWDVMS